MDREALWATVHGVVKDSDISEQLSTAHESIFSSPLVGMQPHVRTDVGSYLFAHFM